MIGADMTVLSGLSIPIAVSTYVVSTVGRTLTLRSRPSHPGPPRRPP